MLFNINSINTLIMSSIFVMYSVGYANEPQKVFDKFLYTSEDKDFIARFNNSQNIHKQVAKWTDDEFKTNRNINISGPIYDAFLKFKAIQKEGDNLYRWKAPKETFAIPSSLLSHHYSTSSDGPIESKISSQYSKSSSQLKSPPAPGISVMPPKHKLFGWCLVRENQVIAVIITNLYESFS